MISPGINVNLFNNLVDQRTTVFALDNIPCTFPRAQSYDVLSSQANIAGYQLVVKAANVFGRFFAGQMTARDPTDPRAPQPSRGRHPSTEL